MAKKKQFAGKKTKLARLPLTQALTSQAEAAAAAALPPPPPSPLSLSLFTQAPLTWDEISAGRGGPLAAAFLFLVRELADLQRALQSFPGPDAGDHRMYLPESVPSPAGIMQALRQARQNLQDLQSRLSHS